MIHTLIAVETASTDPCRNLAVEEHLLHTVQPGQCILYLWQNRRTVVVGRNQNAAAECQIQALEADGGQLVRRLTGGGAVYHDLGNLNFSFLICQEDYDVEKQTAVILQAVQLVGIQAQKTGRNDLTVQGAKFSGHAYYRTAGRCLHHGTLMLDVDTRPLERYLQVSPLKLQAKGVPSVRSRVVNLRQYRPDLTIPQMKQALLTAFSQVYGILPLTMLPESALSQEAIQAGTARFQDPTWRYGKAQPIPLPHRREARFPWGILRLDFALSQNRITQLALWSDGLDADFLSSVPSLLQGCLLEESALRTALCTGACAAPASSASTAPPGAAPPSTAASPDLPSPSEEAASPQDAREEIIQGILSLLLRNEDTTP